MASVRCPECDHKERIPDDYERSTIRCSECGVKIPIEADEDDNSRRSANEDVVRAKKKKKKKAPPSIWASWAAAFARLDTALKIIVGLTIVSLMLSCLHPVFYVVPVGYGSLLILLGGLLFLVVAFNDSPLELLLCLILPFYSLYYLITHFEETKKALFLQLFGMVVCCTFLCAVPLHALVYGTMGGMNRIARNDPPAFNNQPAFNNPPGFNNPPFDDPRDKKPPFEKPPFENPPFKNPPFKNPPIEKPPVEKPLPAKLTGDPQLDKALADLTGQDFFAAKDAEKFLLKTPPNQHRAAVAKKLAELVQNLEPRNRAPALRALGAWATPKEVPVLIQLLSDTDTNTRNEALKVLGKLQDARAVPAMVRSLEDFGTRSNAERALRDMGPIAEKEVLPLLGHKDFTVRVGAINILKDIGTKQSVPALQAAFGGNDIFVREPARQALTAINARAK